MKLYLSIIIVVLSLMAPPVFAENLSELLRNAFIFGSHNKMKIELQMNVQGQRGEIKREILLFFQKEKDDTKVLMQITMPAFLRKMKFLYINKNNREQRWMSSSQGVMSISGGNANRPLFNSDFSLEDISRIDPQLYTLSLKKKTMEKVVVQAESKSKSAIYSKKIFIINFKKNLIESIEYYDQAEKMLKKFEVQEISEKNNKFYPAHSVMKDFINKSETHLYIEHIDFPKNIPSRYFNRAAL